MQKNSAYLNNILTLLSGTAVAQLIGVVSTPILSRMYTPESFGILGSIMAIVGIINTISSLQYELAIVIEKKDHKADALNTLCFYILFSISTFCFFVFVTAKYFFLEENELLGRLLPWGAGIIFFSGFFKIYKYRFNRSRRYSVLATRNILSKLSTVLLHLLFGFMGAQAIGLVLGNFLGIVIASILVFISDLPNPLLKKQNIQKLKEVGNEHYRFPLYSAPQNFINSLSKNLPIYLLGYFFNAETAGFYWFASRILELPGSLIGQSVRQVFYKEAAILSDNTSTLKHLYIKSSTYLLIIIVFPMIILFVFGPSLFAYFFGEDWLVAGLYAKWMFLWVGFNFIIPPSVVLLNVFNKQKHYFIFECILLMIRTISLAIGGIFCNQLTTIKLFSISSMALIIVFFVFVFLNFDKLTSYSK